MGNLVRWILTMLRNAFSNADDEGDLSLDGLLDTTSGQRRSVAAMSVNASDPTSS